MNLKQLGILLVIVVILGGAGLVLHHNQKSSWSSGGADVGKKLLGDFPVNDVTQIHVKQGTNELTLAKSNDLWIVRERRGYPADFSQISQLLLKLRDLKIVQSEEVGPSQYARLNLAPGQGTNGVTIAEFIDANGKAIRTLYLGKAHMRESKQAPSMGMEGGDTSFPDGRYVLTSSNATTVAVISDPLTDINTQPAQWLDKAFFKNEKPRSVSVKFPEATNSWALSRDAETNQWTLADAKPDEKLDESKASEVTGALSSPTFTDVLNPQDGDFSNAKQIEIQDFDGYSYSIKVGAQTNDSYYLKVTTTASFETTRKPGKDETADQKKALDKVFEDNLSVAKEKFQRASRFNNWTYLVPEYTVSPILKTREQLLVEKPSTNSMSEATNEVSGATESGVTNAPVPKAE